MDHRFTPGWRTLIRVAPSVGLLLLSVVAARPLSAATIVIDNGQSGFWSTPFDGTNSASYTVNGNYIYAANKSSQVFARWTPAIIGGFEPGEEYFVQINWGIYDTQGTHDILVTHADGVATASINQSQFAAQGTPLGTLPTPQDNETSGWYTLGRFTLDNDSKVELKALDNSPLCADAVRFSKVFGGEGLIIDETSAGVQYSGSWNPGHRVGQPAVAQSLQYRYALTNPADAGVVYPVGNDYLGPAEVFVSWGVYSTHSQQAQYTFDLDGDPATMWDQTVVSVSQRQMANQSSGGSGVWSGWYSLGAHEIGPNSKVFLSNGLVQTLTADALLAAPIRNASRTVVIDNGKTGYSTSSTSLQTATGTRTVNGNYDYGNNQSGTVATWTPSVVSRLEPGDGGFVFEPGEEYFVQINWGIYDTHGTHEVRVAHADGLAMSPINMSQFAAQGTSLGTLPAPAQNETSGWYTLGQFTLDNNSKVELNALNGSFLSADAVQFSKVFGGEGLIIDETSAGVTYAGTWGQGTRTKTSAPQSMQFRNSLSDHGNAAVTYSLGNDYIGLAEVSLSWGVHQTNSSAVQYLLDLDGDLGTVDDQTVVSVSQQLMADQLTGGAGAWSGWYSVGIYDVGLDTKVFLTNLTSSYLVADALLITPIPEPATVAMLGFGLLAVLIIRRKTVVRP